MLSCAAADRERERQRQIAEPFPHQACRPYQRMFAQGIGLVATLEKCINAVVHRKLGAHEARERLHELGQLLETQSTTSRGIFEDSRAALIRGTRGQVHRAGGQSQRVPESYP